MAMRTPRSDAVAGDRPGEGRPSGDLAASGLLAGASSPGRGRPCRASERHHVGQRATLAARLPSRRVVRGYGSGDRHERFTRFVHGNACGNLGLIDGPSAVSCHLRRAPGPRNPFGRAVLPRFARLPAPPLQKGFPSGRPGPPPARRPSSPSGATPRTATPFR